ncbi:F-box protein At3g07870-like [Mercurialis annua]|uniref:F-box protein At3g07870-like n=1 Tax=Mercurialis annua TaxID=3986 RepID=UPI00215EACF3|nr:F-box protein At3g07870-like [Mercurialis annua]XP_050218360.1 F-box protein At3g07870-like [Mercurialis annua]
MSVYFPEEVILQILYKLPVKKLGQCATVCKSWKFLIKNPSFIITHSNNQTHEPLFLFRLVSNGKERYSLHFDDQSSQTHMAFNSPALKCDAQNRYFRVLGSCKGLICLADDLTVFTNTYVFWNPLIRRFKRLPVPNFTYGDFDAFIGFGFDSVGSDFKLLRFVMFAALEGPGEPQPRVEVFSLKSGVWKDITQIAPKYEIYTKGSQAFVNGFIHFMGYRGDENVILRFHVGDEVFRRIKLPGSLVYGLGAHVYVSGYKQSSIAVFYKNFFGPVEWQVWVMKEYGVVESWTKILTIDESMGLPGPMGFRRNGDLMIECYHGDIRSLEPESRKTKRLRICGENTGYYSFVDSYAESLVLFDRGKK